jgi:chromosomal replication initiator protein
VTDDAVNLAAVWVAATEELANETLSPQQQAWLRLTRPLALVEDTAFIAAPNPFTRDAIESRLRPAITEALSRRLGRSIQLAVAVQPSEDGDQLAGEPVPGVPPPVPAPPPDYGMPEPVENGDGGLRSEPGRPRYAEADYPAAGADYPTAEYPAQFAAVDFAATRGAPSGAEFPATRGTPSGEYPATRETAFPATRTADYPADYSRSDYPTGEFPGARGNGSRTAPDGQLPLAGMPTPPLPGLDIPATAHQQAVPRHRPPPEPPGRPAAGRIPGSSRQAQRIASTAPSYEQTGRCASSAPGVPMRSAG